MVGHLAGKLARLSLREWRELFEAQWALLVAQSMLRSRPTGTLATPVERTGVADPSRMPEARALARAIVRAARYGVFRPQCLVRSMALSRMLVAHGIGGSMVRVGVRRKDGEFLAHAWVELAGETLGDADEHVGTFAPLTNLDVQRPS